MSPPGIDVPSDLADSTDVYTLNICDGLRTAAFEKMLLDAVLALGGKRRDYKARRRVCISVRACKFATPKIIFKLG